MYDLEEARNHGLAAIEAIGKALRGNAETVEAKYLKRLLADRDQLLAGLHFGMGMPVLELSARTGIWWTEIYDIVDRVREERRRMSPFTEILGLGDQLAGGEEL